MSAEELEKGGMNNDEKEKLQSDTEKDRSSLQSVSSASSEGERGYWGSQVDFLLSCIGYAVGLGNLWRFPYLCIRNGGGAFLIPYFFFLFLCGMPLFFMELSIGQFTSLSPLSMWNVAPLFKGLGFGMVIVSGLLCIYYNIIITWTLFYLFNSFTTTLRWGTCDNWWNNKTTCKTKLNNELDLPLCNFTAVNATNLTSFASAPAAATSLATGAADLASNLTSNITSLGCRDPNAPKITYVSSTEQFWQQFVLRISGGIDETGTIRLELFLCLCLAWLIVFGCLFKGVKSSGKVVYVTATVPYIFLTILLIKGLTLDGAGEGLKFYLTPNFKEMLTFKVWAEACLQIFYSLGPAWGGLITMASYNKFNNNCYRDAIMVPLINCLTSFYGGFVIFSILGHMAFITGKNVSDVVKQGPGLAFMTYPSAIAQLPVSPMWAIFFFVMLLTLGLDSQFATLETVISSFVDEWPSFLRKRKLPFTIFMCIVELCLGLVFITNAGMYWFQITDWYCAAFSVVTIAFFECLVIAWIYGADRLYDEIEMMIGYKPFIWWKLCWKFFTPALLFGILVFNLVGMKAPKYGQVTYPGWAVGYGWFLASLSIMPFPIYAVYKMVITPGTIRQRIRVLTRPSPTWGPALEEHRKSYLAKHAADNAATENANVEFNAVTDGVNTNLVLT